MDWTTSQLAIGESWSPPSHRKVKVLKAEWGHKKKIIKEGYIISGKIVLLRVFEDNRLGYLTSADQVILCQLVKGHIPVGLKLQLA